MKEYAPTPKDLAGIAVPETILAVLDRIAENTHDTWARKRMEEGWTYGAELDGFRRTHPSLVPYKDLPETEKEYDRATSLETIRMLLWMGYDITKNTVPF